MVSQLIAWCKARNHAAKLSPKNIHRDNRHTMFVDKYNRLVRIEEKHRG